MKAEDIYLRILNPQGQDKMDVSSLINIYPLIFILGCVCFYILFIENYPRGYTGGRRITENPILPKGGSGNSKYYKKDK